jgi:hypothetical protein
VRALAIGEVLVCVCVCVGSLLALCWLFVVSHSLALGVCLFSFPWPLIGAEFACVQGWGIFDGPTDNTSIAAIKSWNINVIRIPLNEDCWLGINGEEAECSMSGICCDSVRFRRQSSLLWTKLPGGEHAKEVSFV